jgi:hypothetical protein
MAVLSTSGAYCTSCRPEYRDREGLMERKPWELRFDGRQ